VQTDIPKSKEIFKGLVFTNDERKIIDSKFQIVKVKKGDLILKADDVVDSQYYILNGCLRSYHIDAHGKEHTIQFGINNWWISDYTAFFSTSKAVMTIEAIKNATLYKISRENLEDLYGQFPTIESYYRKKLENSFTVYQKRILAELSQSAKERYVDFITTYPEIEKSVKNYHIASYLGITTESLSRIRKELSK
tara:strand:+ start:612 stop:1193 length:582 start_codon:yes stop_codon:yes gene_type:complete